MRGAAKSHHKGNGYRDGEPSVQYFNLPIALCLIHPKLALGDSLTRTTSSMRDIMVQLIL